MKNFKNNKAQREALLNFFEKLRGEMASQVQILALRPKFAPTIESNFEGDFDFVIDKKEFSALVDITCSLCKKSGVNFTLDQRALNKRRFEFFICSKKDLCLTLEFWTAVEFTYNDKKHSFSAKTIFEAINSDKITNPELLSLIYITHLFHKGKNTHSAENRYRFEVFLKDLSNTKLLLDNEAVPGLLREVQSRTFSMREANNEALKLLNPIGFQGSISLSEKIKIAAKRTWNALFHFKRLVPIIGPDGVGKGCVSKEGLAELEKWASCRFKSLYRFNKLYEFAFYKFISLLFFSRQQFFSRSHHRPKNKLDERLSYYIFFMAFCSIRFLFLLKPTKFILLDRYFTDYFGTPIRYLGVNGHPKKIKLYKLLFSLTPVPKNMVYLSCKDSSLIARKDELPIVSVQFLHELYIEFIVEKKVPRILFVSTENPIKVSSDVLSAFLDEINRKK
jgi:hypothetical protein